MKKLFPSFISLAAMLYASLLLSCSSNDEQKPSTGETAKFCVYKDTRTCYSTTQASCPAGGELSDFCPYEGSSVVSSSSVPLSSSSKPSSSSVALSSAVLSSSSSKPTGSVECEGYCKWEDGCVRIATDPMGTRDPSKVLSPILSCDEAISNCKSYSPTGKVFSNSTCDIAVITPSSSSVVPTESIECDGYCLWHWADGKCVRISTDPKGENGTATVTCATAIAHCKQNSSGGKVFSSSTCGLTGDYCNWHPLEGDGCVKESYEGCNCWPIKDEVERRICANAFDIVETCPNGGPPKSSSSSVVPSSSSVVPSSSSSGCIDNTPTQYCLKGILKQYGSVTYEGQTIRTMVIGTQTFTDYLQKNVSGSVCLDTYESKCGARGYDWATAMDFPSNCNDDNTCNSHTPHQGICPSGWHIPAPYEWETLADFLIGRHNSAIANGPCGLGTWSTQEVYVSDGSKGSYSSAFYLRFPDISGSSNIYNPKNTLSAYVAGASGKRSPCPVRCIKN